MLPVGVAKIFIWTLFYTASCDAYHEICFDENDYTFDKTVTGGGTEGCYYRCLIESTFFCRCSIYDYRRYQCYLSSVALDEVKLFTGGRCFLHKSRCIFNDAGNTNHMKMIYTLGNSGKQNFRRLCFNVWNYKYTNYTTHVVYKKMNA